MEEIAILYKNEFEGGGEGIIALDSSKLIGGKGMTEEFDISSR